MGKETTTPTENKKTAAETTPVTHQHDGKKTGDDFVRDVYFAPQHASQFGGQPPKNDRFHNHSNDMLPGLNAAISGTSAAEVARKLAESTGLNKSSLNHSDAKAATSIHTSHKHTIDQNKENKR